MLRTPLHRLPIHGIAAELEMLPTPTLGRRLGREYHRPVELPRIPPPRTDPQLVPCCEAHLMPAATLCGTEPTTRGRFPTEPTLGAGLAAVATTRGVGLVARDIDRPTTGTAATRGTGAAHGVLPSSPVPRGADPNAARSSANAGPLIPNASTALSALSTAVRDTRSPSGALATGCGPHGPA